MTKSLNVAILGFGLSGSAFHAPLIDNTLGLNLTHILSRQKDKIAEIYPHVTVVDNLDVILNDDNIDLVINTLPDSEHYTITKKCLLAGKHVVVEKPFVNNISHGEELIALAKSKNLMLSVYHNRRWDNGFITLKNNLTKLGDIYLYEAYFDRFRPEVNLAKWREQDAFGNGVLFDLGSHLIDQALSLFGMPEFVYADLAMQRPNARTVDYFLLNLIYPHHRVILGSNSVSTAPRPVLAIYGNKGSYVKHGLDPQENMLRAGINPSSADYGVELNDLSGILSISHDGIIQSDKITSERGCYQSYYEGIHNCLTNGGNTSVSAESALNVIKVIDKAILSNRQKQVVMI